MGHVWGILNGGIDGQGRLLTVVRYGDAKWELQIM
jgi:hypothetical protein